LAAWDSDGLACHKQPTNPWQPKRSWPLVARAQQGEPVRRVGVLSLGEADEPYYLRSWRDELQKLGWDEGRDLRLDVRFVGAGDIDRARAGAADLVMLAPDVIFLMGGPALVAAQQETKTIPIVFVGAGDPFETGRVKNTAHPEGNSTGFANGFDSLPRKWVQLLKEVAPNVVRLLYLLARGSENYRRSIEAAAQALALQLVTIPVNDVADLKTAIESFSTKPNGGVLLSPSILTPATERELIRLGEQYRLPMITGFSSFAANGGLMSYHPDAAPLVRGAASYVDRILRGAKVGELPVQYPTTFRLDVNLKAAKAIGLTIPASFLLLADEVVE
jgi:putative tryptophan/tyrosine transport system substrate-binding protein